MTSIERFCLRHYEQGRSLMFYPCTKNGTARPIMSNQQAAPATKYCCSLTVHIFYLFPPNEAVSRRLSLEKFA